MPDLNEILGLVKRVAGQSGPLVSSVTFRSTVTPTMSFRVQGGPVEPVASTASTTTGPSLLGKLLDRTKPALEVQTLGGPVLIERWGKPAPASDLKLAIAGAAALGLGAVFVASKLPKLTAATVLVAGVYAMIATRDG